MSDTSNNNTDIAHFQADITRKRSPMSKFSNTMNKLKLIQRIGNDICEECGPNSDCGIEPEDCDRVSSAILALNEYLMGEKDER